MGVENNTILHYLSDKKRFADLINAEVYNGRQVINPEYLTDISTATYAKIERNSEGKLPRRRERRGDLAMKYKDGSLYRIFVGEAQSNVHYAMPIRNIEYAAAYYKKQYDDLKREHERERDLKGVDEFLSGIKKEDRIKPVHLLWIYHGEKAWDGPRTLKDMMDFGDEKDGFSEIFRDFKPHLLCINEMECTEKYHTELRALLDMLRLVEYKTELLELIETDERFWGLDEETYEAAAILLKIGSIWEKRDKYKDEGGRYSMCKALRDWEAEIRAEERKIKEEQKRIIEKKDEEIASLKEEIRKLKEDR